MRPIAATTLRGWLSDGRELALLDVRDGGPFARGHLLLATNLPLARLEVLAPRMLPRRSVRVVVMDGAEADEGSTAASSLRGPGAAAGAAERAAALLAAHGYSDVHVLDGGLEGWRTAGFEVFSGTNVPSKAFGEAVEHQLGTPSIDAATLRQWRQQGRDVVVVDSRPLEEYRMVSLPGASDCPGAELVLRVPAQVRSDDTVVVVNCAGRTRSIIGCQSLRHAGLRNPVYALRNGTMGWQLAGYEVASGHDNLVPEPDGEGLERARALAADVARRFEVRFATAAQLQAWQADPARTTYVFDVRLPEAYATGHRPGSLNAPGGQLVQSTDIYAAVRHARIVLVDAHEVQAVMTAHWLQQMGWSDVHVLRDGLRGPLEVGAARVPSLGESALRAPIITAAALRERLASVTVIDVGESYLWRAGAIPGSRYAMRSRLASALAGFDRATSIVFSCGDGTVSRHAAEDALRMGFSAVSVLEGGRAAWRAAGAATERLAIGDDSRLLTETDDMWYPPWARAQGAAEAMQQYLTWEVNLLDQIEREPYLKLRPGPGPGRPPTQESTR